MKVITVPAQITTVEDRIAGNLGLTQVLLLAIAIFGSGASFVVLPPTLHDALYKLVVIILIMLICGGLAFRIRGKLLIHWTIIIARYNARPAYYLFSKNCMVARDADNSMLPKNNGDVLNVEPTRLVRPPLLTPAETLRVRELIDSPAANLTFKVNKKGGLDVLITEV